MNYEIEKTHISNIVSGDTIIHTDGEMRTVTNSNIGKVDLLGRTLFGDSYKAGHKLVSKVVFKK